MLGHSRALKAGEVEMTGNTIRVGKVEIMAVADAARLAGPCQMVFPHIEASAWTPHAEHLSEDGKSMNMSITTYVVRSGGKTILIDTGVGAKERPFMPKGRLPEALIEAGVPLESIDIVANTHMHVDHVGWHTTQVGESYLPTFPSSKHLFNRMEWEYFTSDAVANEPTNAHIRDCVIPIRDVVDIGLTEGEYNLTDEITLVPSPGHTIAHQSFVVRSGGEAAIMWGDVCHHPAQVTELWSPIFDMNPEQSRETRERLLQRIEDEGMLLAAGHFPFPGFGNVVRVEGKRYWRGLE
jgi:glyoxylase-like metal-dependent hydrolase (beta-lactamase superfamily II)